MKDISLNVKPGDITALMGKNGVGKSTLLRVLARISAPNSGEIQFNGKALIKGAAQNRSGILYLGHAPGMYPVLSAVENLRLMCRLHGRQIDRKAIMTMLEKVDLVRQSDDPIKIYSQGMLQRLKLCLALLVDWDLLMFDEPFSGLDVQGRALTEEIFAEWKTANRTMLLVVHDFQWIWRLCNRLLIIDQGEIALDTPVNPSTKDKAAAEFMRIVG